jgi:NAD-specific glutamate dehydrogenase
MNQEHATRAMQRNLPIVQRLRIPWATMSERGNNERAEAAAEIERLAAEVKHLKERMVKLLSAIQEHEARDA